MDNDTFQHSAKDTIAIGLMALFATAVMGIPLAMIRIQAATDAKRAIESHGLTVKEMHTSFNTISKCTEDGETSKGSYIFTADDKQGNEVSGVYCPKYFWAQNQTPSVRYGYVTKK